MSKASKRRRVRLNQVRPAYEEALGTTGGRYEFEGNDDVVYSFPHPAFIEDTSDFDEADNAEELAQALLGDQFDQFIEGGNAINDLVLLFQNVGSEYRGKAGKVRISRS